MLSVPLHDSFGVGKDAHRSRNPLLYMQRLRGRDKRREENEVSAGYTKSDLLIAEERIAALEKLLHDAIDVLRHANKYFPLTSAQIVLVRYRKLYPKGRRTK